MSSFPKAKFGFGGFITAVPTIAALRNMPSSASRAKGDTILVNGALEAGDGSGGSYCWIPSSLDNDDGQTTIKPFDMPDDQPGRWRWTTNGNANGVRIDALEQEIHDTDHGLLKLKASITEVDQVRLQGDQALAEQTATLATSVNGAIASLSSSIDTRIASLTTADAAMVTKTDQLRADYNTHQTAITNAQAALTSEAQARANGDAALATQTTNLQTSLQGQIDTTNSRVTTEVQALSNANSAAAIRLGNLEAGITGGTEALSARIDDVDEARIDGDNALATSVTNISSRTGSLESTVGIQAGAINTLNSKNQAYLNLTTAAGSSAAAVRLMADGYAGSMLELQADSIRLGSTLKPAMSIEGGNVVIDGSLRAGSVTTDKLTVGGVTTDRIAANAVSNLTQAYSTVYANGRGPDYPGGTDEWGNSYPGITNSWNLVQYNVVLPAAADIACFANLTQSYFSSPPINWTSEIRINGNKIWRSGGAYGYSDSVGMSGALKNQPAGTYTITLWWWGNPNVDVATGNASLTTLVQYR